MRRFSLIDDANEHEGEQKLDDANILLKGYRSLMTQIFFTNVMLLLSIEQLEKPRWMS